MHDPKVVAFEIRRPWPRRSGRSPFGPAGQRWGFGRTRAQGVKGPWWKASSYSPWWTLAGRQFWFPALITIWHVEPGGNDSGSVCKHWVEGRPSRAWRWHFWHWDVQVHPVDHLKRRLFTRCALCRHPFRRGEAVFSGGWDNDGPRWFRGETNVRHDWCSSLLHLRQQRIEDDAHLLYLLDRITGRDETAVEPVLEDLYGRRAQAEHGDEHGRWFRRRRRAETLVASRQQVELAD